mmetsp:Transcript_27749/g.70035  ORF Transcript_27749/g.70035 Transcript_27749/m.70035 type:complete len:287 (+) Transcript_27749:292-1152(+)
MGCGQGKQPVANTRVRSFPDGDQDGTGTNASQQNRNAGTAVGAEPSQSKDSKNPDPNEPNDIIDLTAENNGFNQTTSTGGGGGPSSTLGQSGHSHSGAEDGPTKKPRRSDKQVRGAGNPHGSYRTPKKPGDSGSCTQAESTGGAGGGHPSQNVGTSGNTTNSNTSNLNATNNLGATNSSNAFNATHNTFSATNASNTNPHMRTGNSAASSSNRPPLDPNSPGLGHPSAPTTPSHRVDAPVTPTGGVRVLKAPLIRYANAEEIKAGLSLGITQPYEDPEELQLEDPP